MENMFIHIFNMGVAAGWLILAVLLLRCILRNMPKNMRCILWGFVGIRLSCPKACVLLTIYWFHPLCWAAYWMFCKDLDTLALGEANLKKRVRNDKRPVPWKTAFAFAVCVAVAVCFLTNPREELFGYRYMVEDVTYYAPVYSDLSVPQASSVFCLTKGSSLVKKEKNQNEIYVQGSVSKITLTNDNFDQYILENFAGRDTVKEISDMLRKENDKTWLVEEAEGINDAFYYILQQKNGDIYLCYGYNNGSEKDDSVIGWIFKIVKSDKIGKK